MNGDVGTTEAPGPTRGRGGGIALAPAFVLSYALALVLVAALVYFGGVWPVLAKTRLLDLFIRVGVVKYHDQNLGFIEGVADHKYYLTSQVPVDWALVAVAVGVFLMLWAVKAFQFHGVVRLYGIAGGLGQHSRAFFYGLGVGSFFPFGLGQIAASTALEGQGRSQPSAAAAVATADLFVVFEIAFFALAGFLALGWIPWLSQLFWPVAILVCLYVWLRRPRGAMRGVSLVAWSVQARRAAVHLMRHPTALAGFAGLSVVAFALEDIAAYTTANAFGVGVEFSVLLMGLVGGYIARLLPLTPGGIGQFEAGFALALWVGGVGFPDAVTLALLDNLIRYIAGTIILGSILLAYGIETNLRAVIGAYAALSHEAT